VGKCLEKSTKSVSVLRAPVIGESRLPSIPEMSLAGKYNPPAGIDLPIDDPLCISIGDGCIVP